MALVRWVACGDSHGDCIDPDSERAFRAFVKDFKPTLRIHLGDIWDMRWLRRSCSDSEKAENVKADFDAGMDFLKWYRPSTITLGNHDIRMWDARENASNGALRQLAGEWIDRFEVLTNGCKVLPYDKRKGIFRLGNVAFAHGYAHGVNAIRQQAMAYGTCVVGHVHRVEAIRVPRVDDTWGYCAGCLCRLDFEYSRANMGTLSQQNGWAFGVTDRKETTVWLAHRTGSGWVYPTGIKTLT